MSVLQIENGTDRNVCPTNKRWNQQFYCLSETTTLSTSCPSASLPLKVEVRVFP